MPTIIHVGAKGGGNTYSENEQRIGTVLDKPLYRKLILSNQTLNSTSIFDGSTINIDKLINAYGYANRAGTNDSVVIQTQGSQFYVQVYKTGNNIVVEKNNNNITLSNVYVWIEYTKTTD